jgi:LPS sulfotransferase NodH
MNAQRHFVVVTHGRTGSSLLIESLRDAGVAAAGELLHDDVGVRLQAAVRGAATPYRDGQDGAEYLHQFYAGAPAPAGFKLHYDHARSGPAATAWDFIIQHPEIAVIHLVRRDLLAAWVSYEVARRTDVWTLWEDEPANACAPFETDPDALGQFFEEVLARRAWVRHAFRERAFLEIRYEEGLRDAFGPTVNRVIEHIGGSGAGPRGPVLKRLSDGFPDRQITNFAELRERFRHTPHEEYFERPYVSGRSATEHPGFCSRPFEFFAVDATGKLRVCCEDWLPTPIGDVRSGSPKEQWNSATAVEIRESILDGSYRFCNATQCPDLVKGTLPPLAALKRNQHRAWVRDGRTVLNEPPRTLSLGYDPTCNLKCPTCRSDFIVLKGEAFDRAAATHKVVLAELLPTARLAIITGHGDAIASRLYLSFLRGLDASKYPELRILLMTNGLTLDSAMWSSLGAARPAISGATISIDAATPETYAVNRGGNFARLRHNLEFLGDLRRRAEIEFLEISFVVQANNFREMKEFVSLGHAVGCSSVLFMKLIHWPGTFDAGEFAQRAVHDRAHPQHREFLELLDDPTFGDPAVDLSNLADLRGPSREHPRVH